MHPYVRSGLMAVGVAAALGVLAAAFVVSETGGEDLPAAVESITPVEGALTSPQGSIGADLADDHTGVILVDGAEIPLDQLNIVEPLGQVFFTPGDGKVITELQAGTHRATVVYWPKSQTRADASSVSWQFRVG